MNDGIGRGAVGGVLSIKVGDDGDVSVDVKTAAPPTLVDVEWLRERLLADGRFQAKDVHSSVMGAALTLGVHGVHWRDQVESMLASKPLQARLDELLVGVIRRESGATWDVTGWATWGAAIFVALGTNAEVLTLRAVRELVANYPEAIDGLARSHKVTRNGLMVGEILPTADELVRGTSRVIEGKPGKLRKMRGLLPAPARSRSRAKKKSAASK